MRVALCISGQPRSYKVAYEYIKTNFLETHNPDIFVHVWSGDRGAYCGISALYEPKKIIYEQPFEKSFFKRYERIGDPTHPAVNTVQMFYSLFCANMAKIHHEMREGFKYDYVVKLRFDYALNRVLPFEQVEEGKIYVPAEPLFPNLSNHVECNDQMAFGTSKAMDLYSSTFINLDRLYDMGIMMNGENMLSGNLQINNLVLDNMVYVDMKPPFEPCYQNSTRHSLVRDDYEKWKPNND